MAQRTTIFYNPKVTVEPGASEAERKEKLDEFDSYLSRMPTWEDYPGQNIIVRPEYHTTGLKVKFTRPTQPIQTSKGDEAAAPAPSASKKV